MTTPTSAPAPTPHADPRVLLDVAEGLPRLTGPNAVMALVRDIRLGGWDEHFRLKSYLAALQSDDIDAFAGPRTADGRRQPTEASLILDAAHRLARDGIDPTEANIDGWLAQHGGGLRVGQFMRNEQRQRGYVYPAAEQRFESLVYAQAQLDAFRELTELGVHTDPVAALRADPQRVAEARAALERLQLDHPELNADRAEEFAQARFAHQDALDNRAAQKDNLVTQVKGSAHTKSALALAGVGAAGTAGLDVGTDFSKPAALLVGVGLPLAYAVLDKLFNRNRDSNAPKPVRDAGRAYLEARGTARSTKQHLNEAERALQTSFAPQRQNSPGRGR